ncbi:MAG: transposase, partial [Methanothrix sp.]
MLQTLMVRLDPDDEQYKILLETMHRFNEACNYIAEVAYSIGKANKYVVHRAVYYDVRKRFGLSAQLTVRAISKVVEAYKRDRSVKP